MIRFFSLLALVVTLASCSKEECLPVISYAQPYSLGVATYVFYEDGSAVAIDAYNNELPCRYELSADGMLVVNLAAAPKFGWNPAICAFQTSTGQVLR
jgi:hypothetical protein